MIKFKVFLNYTGYWIVFAFCFAVMFVLFLAAAAGIPLGVMLFIFGVASLLFNENLIITELAPTFMLFGGLSLIFIAAALGLIGVKLGFWVSRRFLRIKRRCDRLRDW